MDQTVGNVDDGTAATEGVRRITQHKDARAGFGEHHGGGSRWATGELAVEGQPRRQQRGVEIDHVERRPLGGGDRVEGDVRRQDDAVAIVVGERQAIAEQRSGKAGRSDDLVRGGSEVDAVTGASDGQGQHGA